MSGISTHILDTARGEPAAGVSVMLEKIDNDGAATTVGKGSTDHEGRIRQLVPADFQLSRGAYRLTFATDAYFAAQQVESFYPNVTVLFVVKDSARHHHVPLLLSPFGYSTYRGT